MWLIYHGMQVPSILIKESRILSLLTENPQQFTDNFPWCSWTWSAFHAFSLGSFCLHRKITDEKLNFFFDKFFPLERTFYLFSFLFNLPKESKKDHRFSKISDIKWTTEFIPYWFLILIYFHIFLIRKFA